MMIWIIIEFDLHLLIFNSRNQTWNDFLNFMVDLL